MQNLRNLFNQALTTIGNAPEVTNPEGAGRSLDLLKLWYPVARHAVFTAAHWPCLRVYKRLSLAATRDPDLSWTNADPAPEFLYAFAYPSNMLQPQHMADFSPFRLGRLGSERVVMSNSLTPVLAYTMDDDSPANWDPDVYRCVVWSLAACLNMQKNGKMALTQKLEQQVVAMVDQANENAANADDTYYESIPSFWAGTGFSVPIGSQAPRFFYPTSSFSITGLSL